MEGWAELGRNCLVLASGVGRAAWLRLSRDLNVVRGLVGLGEEGVFAQGRCICACNDLVLTNWRSRIQVTVVTPVSAPMLN